MTSEDEFRVGDVVTDEKGAAVPALIVEIPGETAEEYVVSSSASGARITLADRYDHVPPTDPSTYWSLIHVSAARILTGRPTRSALHSQYTALGYFDRQRESVLSRC